MAPVMSKPTSHDDQLSWFDRLDWNHIDFQDWSFLDGTYDWDSASCTMTQERIEGSPYTASTQALWPQEEISNRTRPCDTTLPISINLDVPNTGRDVESLPDSTEAARASGIRPAQRSKASASRILRCAEPGCRHPGTFSRRWELQRHVMSKHGRSKPFFCNVHGCFKKGTAPPSFSRYDKLTQHIKDVHSLKALAACPVDTCRQSHLPINLLAIHIESAHSWVCDVRCRDGSAENGSTRAVINAARSRFCKCPWWTCSEKLSTDTLLPHLLTHTSEELIACEPKIRTEGFILQRNQGTIDGIWLACPVCAEINADHAAFARHLTDCHILKQDGYATEHYCQWQQHVRANTGRSNEFTAWESWERGRWVDGASRTCPACSEEVDMESPGSHHLDLLRDEQEVIAELYPVRQQILRLYPAFASHPVFNDLK